MLATSVEALLRDLKSLAYLAILTNRALIVPNIIIGFSF